MTTALTDERLREALEQCIEAFRLTREYVGEDTLPAIPGWSWFDAVESARAALEAASPAPVDGDLVAELRARVIGMTPRWEKERRAAYEAVDALIAAVLEQEPSEAMRQIAEAVRGADPDERMSEVRAYIRVGDTTHKYIQDAARAALRAAREAVEAQP